MKKNNAAHEFALYIHDLQSMDPQKEQELHITEPVLVHRITRVLRLSIHEPLIVFDRSLHIRSIVRDIKKKRVVILIKDIEHNKLLQPHISVLLPLLKREAFEQAIYSLVELGANTIQLIKTEKIQRIWHGQKELKRLHHIMIAAAEQSKNFAFPLLREPVALSDMLLRAQKGVIIFFDINGKPLWQTVSEFRKEANADTRYIVLVGPEGDLTESEKVQLQKEDVLFIRLTPTVLRTQQAIAVGIGALRSLL